MWLLLVMQGVSKEVLQWYSKCHYATSVTKTFTLKGVQTFHRSTSSTMDSLHAFKRKRFRNTRDTVTFGIFKGMRLPSSQQIRCYQDNPIPLAYAHNMMQIPYFWNTLHSRDIQPGVRVLQGVCKIECIFMCTCILFLDKHWLIWARFRVSHRRPGHKDIRLTGQNHINNWY
jgi:hypothetical protein